MRRCTGCGPSTRGRSRASSNVRTASGSITGHSAPAGSWPLPKGTSSRRSGSTRRTGTILIASPWSRTGCWRASSSTRSWWRPSRSSPPTQWVRAAEEAGLGMTTVRSPGEALADKSFLADGCVVEVDDPEQGLIHHAGPLLEFSATPGAVAGPAPRSGQHTEEVLAEARSGPAGPGTCSRVRGVARAPLGGRSGPRPRARGRGAVHRACPRRPRGRRHQDQRAATTNIGTARTWVWA